MFSEYPPYPIIPTKMESVTFFDKFFGFTPSDAQQRKNADKVVHSFVGFMRWRKSILLRYNTALLRYSKEGKLPLS